MPPTPEAQLAYLGFQRIAPSPLLRTLVRSYWYFWRATPLGAYHEEYMHPSGGFGVVFNLGDRPFLDAEPLSEPVFLDGANTRSRRMGFAGRVELLGVRFWEGGAYPFLGIPLSELRNETALLDASGSLGRAELLDLHGRLYEADSLAARVGLLEAWLIDRLTLGKTRNALIPASLALLQRTTQPIPRLAQGLGVSQRQLERLYQAQVGMSPKQYAGLVRVETARLALKGGGESAASVAVDSGFYDQAHFIREFSAVIGMTPNAYVKRSRG